MKTEIYKDEGYKLMGVAFEVYNEQGYGLAEEIYQESMEIELASRGILFHAKQELKCFYKERELKKHYVADLSVFEGLIVELKSVSTFAPEHEAQLINYMR
ncbi:MAG: GxxExxY protein, partial [Limisphaerales bacterium]